MTKTGVMICGHGSRSQSAVDEFAVLAEKLPALLPPEWEVDYGYLEFANPVIREGLDLSLIHISSPRDRTRYRMPSSA